MSDSYQAIYDATRSKIGQCDTSEIVSSAFSSQLSGVGERLSEAAREVANEMQRPSILFRPSLCIDGNQWRALYGENLQDGVAGFGDSPSDAMSAFDAAWWKKLPSKSNDAKGEQGK